MLESGYFKGVGRILLEPAGLLPSKSFRSTSKVLLTKRLCFISKSDPGHDKRKGWCRGVG